MNRSNNEPTVRINEIIEGKAKCKFNEKADERLAEIIKEWSSERINEEWKGKSVKRIREGIHRNHFYLRIQVRVKDGHRSEQRNNSRKTQRKNSRRGRNKTRRTNKRKKIATNSGTISEGAGEIDDAIDERTEETVVEISDGWLRKKKNRRVHERTQLLKNKKGVNDGINEVINERSGGRIHKRISKESTEQPTKEWTNESPN